MKIFIQNILFFSIWILFLVCDTVAFYFHIVQWEIIHKS